MPTYSYRCTECDTAFDIQQTFADDSLTVCPTCEGKLRKVFSAIGVSFTGSGFYRNDARAEAGASRDSKPGKKPAEKSADGTSGSSTSTSTEKSTTTGEKSSGTPAAKENKRPAGSSPSTSPAGPTAPKSR